MSKTKASKAVFTIHSQLVDPGTPRARTVEWGEFVQPMSGALEGRTCRIRFHLIDGQIHVGNISYETETPQPIGHATNRALRDLRLGDVPADAEECLKNIAKLGHGLEWLEAFERGRSRAGKGGYSAQMWALIAYHRVEAERLAPGNAIRYMAKRWAGDGRGATYTSVDSATSKVNKAIAKGMLELGPDGPQLTDEARQYLSEENDA